MTLEKYWQKRDFGKTPEPRGQATKTGKKLSYFIQKHDASHLHYDFRLELDGTLKSWAIPKGPSLDPADKRLAVHVEDHPVEYGSFEGEIPAHQYGAGTVLVWDRGYWTPEGDPVAGLKKGRLKFRLLGKKLEGAWTLVRMGAAGKKENWLLIKERDDYAKTGTDADITTSQPDSVLSGKGKKTAMVKQSVPRGSSARTTIGDSIAKIARMPDFIKPQLATLADRAPSGAGWLSEIKFDGYRALCRIDNDSATLFTRAGNDWTGKWPLIAAAAAHLPVEQAWLDGEVVAIAQDGSISFQLLQNMANKDMPAQLAYYVFDLLYLNGHDLREVPLLQRKQLLKKLLDTADTDSRHRTPGPILFSDHLVNDADDAFSHACMHGLEGIVVKQADAVYTSDRSRSWFKVKCMQRQEFVIGGYTDPAGSREKFGALLAGVYDEHRRLRYVGRIGTGFDAASLKNIAKEFAQLASPTSPFDNPPTGREAAGVHWLQPKMVAEATFAQWTSSNIIRHASFIGMRNDKPAADVQREIPLAPTAQITDKPALKGKGLKRKTEKSKNPVSDNAIAAANNAGNRRTATSSVSSKDSGTVVAGVNLTHPSRILFADVGLTKLDLARYYEKISAWILPHLADRPLTLVRCPDGSDHACFFQKHVNATTAAHIDRIEVPSGGATATYMMANSTAALVSMVQMGALELHTWGSHEGRLGQPDRIIFDLDPAPDVAWPQVIEAAQLVHALLEEIGLGSFVKTTGGKGLHVVAPLKPDRPWEQIKPFTRAIAEHLEHTFPDRFTSKMTKTKRPGKIFIDYLRNAAEATAVAAYSMRARPGAPVSVPIGWDELSEELHSDSFNVLNLPDRLDRLKQDPWHDYFQLKQRVSTKAMRTFGIEGEKS